MNQNSPFKGKTGVKRVFNAAQYSVDGFKSAFKKEAAFRQIILINIVLVPTTFFLNVSAAEQAIMITVCLLSIIVELFNSAIEAVVDLASPTRHPLAARAKDVAAGAVLIAAIGALIIATIIVVPRLAS